MRCLLACLWLAATAGWARSARILAVLSLGTKSHHHMHQAALKTLAERGHQVVNYSPFPLPKPFPNYTDFHLENIEIIGEKFSLEELEAFMDLSPFKLINFIWSKPVESTILAFENKKIKKLLESNEKFDLVVLEPFFGQEALVGLGHKFNAPVISFHTFGSFSLVNKVSGNSLLLSYIPDIAFPFSDHMTFYEKLQSSYSTISTLYSYYANYLPAQDEYMKTVFKDPTMPSIVDMLHNISLYVNNVHPNVHYAQPYPPNTIPLGGIHLEQDRKELPTAMKKFLDEAKQGVVYISLGSIVPDHVLPQEFFDNFINVFRRLPQRVLWKTGSNHSGLPDNVMTAKWVSQQDILAHPNVVLFLTHGGLLSQHETINAGVPVVCVPFFGDQPLNARFYEERQIGIKLPFKTLSEETIYSALSTVLNNPKYKENMKRLSTIYRDRPVSAKDSLVFWVEYVLRHRGAQHLRPASAGLSWYQLSLLDVLAVILAALALLVTLLYLVLTRVLRLLKSFLHSGTRTRTKKTN